MKKARRLVRWGLLWRSCNHLDGERRHLICGEGRNPALFHTRQQARDFARERYGYIKERRDLRAEPHGWRMPLPVRVGIEALS